MRQIAIAIGFGLVLGLSVFFYSKVNPTATPFSFKAHTKMQPSIPIENLTNGEITTTMPDIINQGHSLECDWKIPFDGSKNPFTSGTLWTTENKGRSTINVLASEEVAEANTLYLNNTAYTWALVSGQKTGMKFNPATLEEFNRSMTQEERQLAETTRASMIFTCQPWTPNESKFLLPSDVEFEEK